MFKKIINDNTRFKYIELLTHGSIQKKEDIIVKSGDLEFLSPVLTKKGIMAFQEELGLKVFYLKSIYEKAGVSKEGLDYFNEYGYLNNANVARYVALINFLNQAYAEKHHVSLGLDMHDTHSSGDVYNNLATINFAKQTHIYWIWLGIKYDVTKRRNTEKYLRINSNLIPTKEDLDNGHGRLLCRDIEGGLLLDDLTSDYNPFSGVALRALKNTTTVE